jgi:hypothetical protein
MTATLTLSSAPRNRVVEAATAAVAKEKNVRLECSGIGVFLYLVTCNIAGLFLPAQNHTIFTPAENAPIKNSLVFPALFDKRPGTR